MTVKERGRDRGRGRVRERLREGGPRRRERSESSIYTP